MTANKLTNYRIGELEKKVDKHNNAIEQIAHARNDIELLKAQYEEQRKKEETDKQELKGDIADLQNQIDNTDEKVNNLNINMTGMKGEISELKTVVKSYHEK